VGAAAEAAEENEGPAGTWKTADEAAGTEEQPAGTRGTDGAEEGPAGTKGVEEADMTGGWPAERTGAAEGAAEVRKRPTGVAGAAKEATEQRG
jgi:hypothetical protein